MTFKHFVITLTQNNMSTIASHNNIHKKLNSLVSKKIYFWFQDTDDKNITKRYLFKLSLFVVVRWPDTLRMISSSPVAIEKSLLPKCSQLHKAMNIAHKPLCSQYAILLILNLLANHSHADHNRLLKTEKQEVENVLKTASWKIYRHSRFCIQFV